jgi:hypothetical protein
LYLGLSPDVRDSTYLFLSNRSMGVLGPDLFGHRVANMLVTRSLASPPSSSTSALPSSPFCPPLQLFFLPLFSRLQACSVACWSRTNAIGHIEELPCVRSPRNPFTIQYRYIIWGTYRYDDLKRHSQFYILVFMLSYRIQSVARGRNRWRWLF